MSHEFDFISDLEANNSQLINQIYLKVNNMRISRSNTRKCIAFNVKRLFLKLTNQYVWLAFRSRSESSWRSNTIQLAMLHQNSINMTFNYVATLFWHNISRVSRTGVCATLVLQRSLKSIFWSNALAPSCINCGNV